MKVRDWIDVVFVKRRFYTADASHAASVSRTQVCLARLGHVCRLPLRNHSLACDEWEAMLVVCHAVSGERSLHSIS